MATKKRSEGEDGLQTKPKGRVAKSNGSRTTGSTRQLKATRIRSSHASTVDSALGERKRTSRAKRAPHAIEGERAQGRKVSLASPKRTTTRRKTTSTTEPSQEARKLALALAAAGLEKKAIGVEILEVVGRVDYTDYLVIMTGRSDRHVHAIASGLEEAMRKDKVSPLSIEGMTAATWVLLDFGDVVVHVFQEDTRRLYDLEGLWIDAGRIAVPDDGPQDGSGAKASTCVL